MNLKDQLKTAQKEKDVENIYRAAIINSLDGSEITSPYSVDGLLVNKTIRTLLEFKYDFDFKNKTKQCDVLTQCLFYLKKFEEDGIKVPSTIFIGDINECFAIHTNSIIKYLSSDIDWKIAASQASSKNPDLIMAMVGDTDIMPFVYNVDDNFNIKDVLEKIKDLSDNIVKKVRITTKNIVNIFNYFDNQVIGKTELTTNQKANLFIQIIINPGNNYAHPNRKNTLVTASFGDVTINKSLFNAFFGHFEGDIYSPKEKENLTGLVDRIVEDTVRRRKGEFFTPTVFVDESQKYITDALGPEWREEYVVWDCAWGTGNLTRDYKFKELYCSTLEQSDIDTANQIGYNRSATKFQFDFLNDDDSKLPAGLVTALNDPTKKILFYINPPYGTAGNQVLLDDKKAGIANTEVGKLMKEEKWGAASQQLYAQFLYKISKYNIHENVTIAVYSPSLYKTGGSYIKFRENFYKKFHFESGMLFCASHFADTASSWGVDFSIWTSGTEDRSDLPVDVLDTEEQSENIVRLGTKVLYNLDNRMEASEWIRQEVKASKTIDAPLLTSALNVKQTGCGAMAISGLGYCHSNSNSIKQNQTLVGLYSNAFSDGHGFSVIPSNFEKATALFAARKLITSTWINQKDEYIAPDEKHSAYQQFVNDSLVYSLFNNSSQQSSMRQVDYKDKKHDIKNEFFWMSNSAIRELAVSNHYDELYRDTVNEPSERFVFNKLATVQLSPDASEVLNLATQLVLSSVNTRKTMSEESPEFHLDSWDAGYAQLKLVWKKFHADEFKKFRDSYKAMEDRMRPLVYELGFLK